MAAESGRLRRQMPSSLAVFAAVLWTRPRFRKISICILEDCILVAVAHLAVQVGLAIRGRGTDFFFDRALMDVTVRRILLYHRPHTMTVSLSVLYGAGTRPRTQVTRPLLRP